MLFDSGSFVEIRWRRGITNTQKKKTPLEGKSWCTAVHKQQCWMYGFWVCWKNKYIIYLPQCTAWLHYLFTNDRCCRHPVSECFWKHDFLNVAYVLLCSRKTFVFVVVFYISHLFQFLTCLVDFKVWLNFFLDLFKLEEEYIILKTWNIIVIELENIM